MNRESEYKKILEMLQEGKIEAEEAEKLIAAIGGRTSDTSKSTQTDSDDIKEETTTPDRGELQHIIKGAISSILGSWGPGQTYEREVNGEFDPEVLDKGLAVVKAKAKNGRIDVKGWDSDEYRIVVRAKARGNDRDKAKEVAEQHCHITQQGSELIIDGRENLPTNSSISMEIYLPKAIVYDGDLLTSNGRIEISKLKTKNVVARTSNGKISCEKVASEVVRLNTSNGRVQADEVSGDVYVQTSNGAIRIAPSNIKENSTYDASTSNGKISFNYSIPPDVGVDFEGRTSNGKIKLDWDDVQIEEERGRRKRKTYIKGKAGNYDEKDIHVCVNLKTTNGKISFRE